MERTAGFGIIDAIDILLVSVAIYWVLRLIRGTRALYMLVGLAFAILLYWVSLTADLYTLNWILSNISGSLLLVIVVVFQNDIRRMLTQLGRTPIFSAFIPRQGPEVVEELVRTCVSLANKKIGAILVLERDADVMDYVEVGIRLEARVSRELITTVFLPVTPIHDGAVVIQKGRITAAGCFLPLTMNPIYGLDLGTRHRAALGLSEETDAVVLVVSEEKGWISLCAEGHITQGLDAAALRKMLMTYFRPEMSPWRRLWTQAQKLPRYERT